MIVCSSKTWNLCVASLFQLFGAVSCSPLSGGHRDLTIRYIDELLPTQLIMIHQWINDHNYVIADIINVIHDSKGLERTQASWANPMFLRRFFCKAAINLQVTIFQYERLSYICCLPHVYKHEMTDVANIRSSNHQIKLGSLTGSTQATRMVSYWWIAAKVNRARVHQLLNWVLALYRVCSVDWESRSKIVNIHVAKNVVISWDSNRSSICLPIGRKNNFRCFVRCEFAGAHPTLFTRAVGRAARQVKLRISGAFRWVLPGGLGEID